MMTRCAIAEGFAAEAIMMRGRNRQDSMERHHGSAACLRYPSIRSVFGGKAENRLPVAFIAGDPHVKARLVIAGQCK